MLSFAYKGSDHTDVKFTSVLDVGLLGNSIGNCIAQRVGDMCLSICLLLCLFFGF